MSEDRIAKFEERRKQLREMNDEQLKARFWELCGKMVEPMVDYGRKYTSQSIERSVLLRMGIDSVTSQGAVSRIYEAGLLGKGAGHVLLKLSQKLNVDVRAAAKRINEDKEALNGLF